jgi:PrtD family type I secretion system ABC transporter
LQHLIFQRLSMQIKITPCCTWLATVLFKSAAYLSYAAVSLLRRVRALFNAQGSDERESSSRAGGRELRIALLDCRGALVGLGLASSIQNLLMLVGPLFMLQVYDRVLPSRSVPTLIGLGLLALLLFVLLGVMDSLRARILTRLGRAWHEQIAERVFDTVLQSALKTGSIANGIQPLRDIETLRSFISGAALTALFDLPWMPLYVGICFFFHPWIGVAVLVGALLLCLLTLLTEVMTRMPTSRLVAIAGARHSIAETALHNAVVVHALGLRGRMADRWAHEGAAFLDAQQRLADVSGGFGSLSRTFRMAMQSAILALGAYLVIQQEATAGVMLAATILSVRALAPVELSIANWRGFLNARQSWQRLSDLFAANPPARENTPLPRPSSALRVTSLSLLPPGGQSAVLHDASFTLNAGTVLGVVGPSGSGKSSLARALVGAWSPARGTIRLDGASLGQWNSDVLGSHVGYLPQDVALFPGTIAQNIARFEPNADPDKLRKAARAAGVHDLILRMSHGFETQVGDGGTLLSGGQRQRIGLARALYNDPFLVVLDEPNANLDGDGEAALEAAIGRIRGRNGIVVLIAHRPNVLQKTDFMLILNEGHVQGFGPTNSLLPAITGQTATPAPSPAPDTTISRNARHAAAR